MFIVYWLGRNESVPDPWVSESVVYQTIEVGLPHSYLMLGEKGPSQRENLSLLEREFACDNLQRT